MIRTTTTEVTSEPSFRHEALLYDALDEFVDRTARFVEDGVDGGQPVMVVVSGAKIDRLRDRLGSAASVVHFADMDDVGTNPARIIPAWQDFVDEWGSPGQAVRGVGEPLHPDRDPDAVVECEHHEALLNVAFAGARFWLVCPFDREALAPDVTAGACDTHPWVSHHGVCTASPSYDGDHVCDTVLDDPLPPLPPTPA